MLLYRGNFSTQRYDVKYHWETVWKNSVADCKMKHTHMKNQRFVDQHEDDFEETAATRKCRYQEKRDNNELFTVSPSGRYPEYHSGWNDWGDDWDLDNFEDTYDKDMTEIAGTSSYRQLLQIRNKINTMKCPPIIASDKMPKCQWEDKPMLVMKSTKRKMSRRN